MTLSTDVYVHDPIDVHDLFAHCNELIGAPADVRYDVTDEYIANAPMQGLCAWLWVYRSNNVAEGHWEDCDESCTYQHGPAHWARVDFDTAYGYDEDGEGPGDLHARLVANLGKWLDDKGVRWSWRNEFTGEIHQGYHGLTELGPRGAEASAWFRDIVLPGIAAQLGGEPR